MLGAARGLHSHGTIKFCDSLSRPIPVGGRRRVNVAPFAVGRWHGRELVLPLRPAVHVHAHE